MKRNYNLRMTLSLITLIAGATLLIDASVSHIFSEKSYNKKIFDTTSRLNEISRTIQGRIEQNLSLIGGLNAYVSQNPYITEAEFQAISGNIMMMRNILSTISLSEGYTLKYVYPYNDITKQLVGLDLLTLDQQKMQAVEASQTRSIILEGPVSLVQKGTGIIGRQAYYYNNEFKGMISAVIDMRQIMSLISEEAKNNHLTIAVRKFTGNDIYGNPRLFSEQSDAPVVTVMMFNLVWEMSGIPDTGLDRSNPWALYTHSASMIFFLIATALLVYKHQREEENSRLNTLLSMSQKVGQMGSFVFNRKKDTVLLSGEAYNLLRQNTNGSLSLDEFITFVAEDDRENVLRQLTDSFPADKIDIVFKTADTMSYIKLTAIASFNINSEFSGYQGILSDITEQTITHNSLTESEERFRDLIMCTSDFVWEMDTNCRYTYFIGSERSVSGAHMLGKSPSFNDKSSDEGSHGFFCNTIVRNGLPIKDMEHWVIDNDGRERCYLMNGVPFFDSKGVLKGYRGVDKDITEQLKLRLEREMIFRASRDGLAIVDTDTNFKDCNQAYLDMTGYSREEILTMTCREITHEDDLEKTEEMLNGLQITGFYERFEKRCRKKDGQFITVQMTLTMMQDDRILISSRDVTDIKKYQDAVEKSEKTLKSVIEVSPIPLCLMDKRGRMININNMFTETFGYTLEEISITRSWWRLIYPDAASRQIIYKKWKTYVRQSGKGFTPEPIQTVAVCKDGTQRDILFHFSSMKDMAVAAFYDITSRVETEKKLQEYIDIVDKNVAISNTDEKGYITSASEAFSKLCGYTVSELLGKRHEIMHHPDVSAEQYKELVRTIATAKTWSGELKKLTRDGEVFWTDTRISPVIKGDDIAGFMYIDQDITDKKRIEELSVTDKLTGIYNRIRLDSALYDEFLRFKRLDEVFSIILFDIDFFKKVNDTYGHLVGDDVLRALAKLVKSSLRETDIFGRWGGEEFLVVCCGSDEDGSYTLAEKLRQKVALYEFPAVETLTCSFGVAQIDNDGTDAMIKRADDALYAAKQNGRNRVER